MNIKKKTINVLLVEDDESDRRLTKLIMAKFSQAIQFNIKTAETLSEAAEHLRHSNYDAILLDLGLPDSNGIDTVRNIHNASPDTPVIVLTGLDDEEMGLEAIKSGAEDYVVKGKALEYVLVRTIQYAIERKQIKNALEVSQKQAEENVLAVYDFETNLAKDIRNNVATFFKQQRNPQKESNISNDLEVQTSAKDKQRKLKPLTNEDDLDELLKIIHKEY